MTENSLVHRSRPAGQSSRIDPSLEGLAAGQYWRTTTITPAYKSEVGHRERPELAEGTVLLVAYLNVVDGFLHSVNLAPHPDGSIPATRFLAEEFFTSFTHEPEGPAIRQQGIDAIMRDVQQIQSEMREGPRALPMLPPSAAATDVASLVERASSADKMQNHLLAVQEEAKSRQLWLTDKNNALADRMRVLADFYSEHSHAIRASVSDAMDTTSRLMAGVRSLGLYTGEGVEAIKIATGDPAPVDTPVTIYQRRLFLDEEVAAHSFVTGLDCDTLDTLPAILAEDPAILDRIAPAQRAVVLMRLRRQNSPIPRDADILEIFAHIEKAGWDKENFLFIRDGGNAYLVRSDLLWSFKGKRDDIDANGLVRLFPSRGDLDQPFRGISGREIQISDLEYVEARSRFDDRTLAYKRLLILMMGLQEREGLFGQFTGTPRWMDLEWQHENFVFVRDDEMAIESKQESWLGFLSRHNDLTQPGSRVYCRFKDMIHHEVLPTLYTEANLNRYYADSKARKAYTDWFADESEGVVIVGTHAERAFVPVPVARERGDETKRKTVRADLIAIRRACEEDTVICLDDMRTEDLERLIESRRDRKDYLSYLGTFITLKKILDEDRRRAEPTIAAITAACVEARIAEEDEARQAAGEALRLFRAANGGAEPPSVGSKPYGKLLDLVFIILDKDVSIRTAAEEIATKRGGQPLRLAVDANGDITFYMTVPQAERTPLLDPYPWVLSARLRRSRDGLTVRGTWTEGFMREVEPSEYVTERWPDEAAWVRQPLPFRLDPGKLRLAIAEVAATTEADIREFLNPTAIDLDKVAERILASSVEGSIARIDDILPVAISVTKRSQHVLPRIVFLSRNSLVRAAQVSEQSREAICKWIEATHRSPSWRLESVAEELESLGVNLVSMPLTSWTPGLRHTTENKVETLVSPVGRRTVHRNMDGNRSVTREWYFLPWRKALNGQWINTGIMATHEHGDLTVDTTTPIDGALPIVAPGLEAALDELSSHWVELAKRPAEVTNDPL